MKTTLFNLLSLLVGLLMATACAGLSAATPTPTYTPFPMAGCNAIKDIDGILWFDETHEGQPYVIPTSGYIHQPAFFTYYRADCVAGYPRVVASTADTNCVNQQVRWETDGGWSCFMPDGSWHFQAGGVFLWPRGKPEGYIDPRPIIPEFPIPAPDGNPQG